MEAISVRSRQQSALQAEKSDSVDFKRAVLEQLELDDIITSHAKTDKKIESIISELMGMKLGMGDGLEKLAALWLNSKFCKKEEFCQPDLWQAIQGHICNSRIL